MYGYIDVSIKSTMSNSTPTKFKTMASSENEGEEITSDFKIVSISHPNSYKYDEL